MTSSVRRNARVASAALGTLLAALAMTLPAAGSATAAPVTAAPAAPCTSVKYCQAPPRECPPEGCEDVGVLGRCGGAAAIGGAFGGGVGAASAGAGCLYNEAVG